MNWDECLTRNPRDAARTIGHETFIVSLSDTTLHLLPNEVATRIWQLADGYHTLREIHEVICREYDGAPAEAETDLIEFVQALVSKGIATLQPCRPRGQSR